MKSGKPISKSMFGILAGTLMASSMLAFGKPVYAEEDLPSRDIYVVYDDSGSMYKNYATGENVDTWSKAKYSMEVFASMLGEQDVMKVYYMSDYSKDGKADGPKITIKGDDDPNQNILKIQEQKTASKDTPFEAVEEAYDDLEDSSGEEKWLIVLTDGQFLNGNGTQDEQKNKLDQFLNEKDSDINVIFLGLGQEAQNIDEVKSRNIYSERAVDSNQILEKVTEVFNRVYNTNSLKEIGSDGTFELDVPMSRITVFVQGDGSKVKSLKDADGKEVGELVDSVKVSTTEKSDNSEHPDSNPKERLQGEIAIYEGEFTPGTYQVNTENAAKTEIYYQPNLAVTAYLTNSNGERVDETMDLPSGDYTLHFEMISGLDGSLLPENNIIDESGDIEYEAHIKNNGKLIGEGYNDGDTIHVEEGGLEIDVTATFLRYNRVHDNLALSAFSDKAVTFESSDPSDWTLNKTLEANEPYFVSMKVEGKTPTEQEWEQVGVPEIVVDENAEAKISAPIIEKTEEPGVFAITPNSEQSDFNHVPYGKETLKIVMDQSVDSIPWQGESDVELNIQDQRNWFIKHLDWIARNWWWAILLPILLLIIAIGYIPGVKKYLPKLPKKMNIGCVPKDSINGKAKNEPSVLIVDTKNKILPYVAQTAKFAITPGDTGEEDYSKMKVKAASNHKMIIENLNAFDDGKVSINDEVVGQKDPETDQAVKIKPIGRTAEITVDGRQYTYELTLNEKYSAD